MESEREHWSKKREYLLAAAGNVVGLGNVWRFPYLCYKNGGGVFLVPYCLFAVLIGVPMYLLETVIGQQSQEGAVTCWKKLCPLAQGIGFSILIIQLYSRVYMIILAWSLYYLIHCFSSTLPWTTCANAWNTDQCVELASSNLTHQFFSNMTGNDTIINITKSSVAEFWERGALSMSTGIEEMGGVKWSILLCLFASWLACYFCIWKGVRSTGKVVYFTAIFPYVILAILLIRGLTLPGAWQGIVFYLYPDASRLGDLQVWMDACSQVLFSYGLASGSLIILSSYNKVQNKCYRDSLWLCVLNSGTSFVAGFAIFSSLGFMSHKQAIPIDMVVGSGPGLAFIAFPQALSMMPLPQLWSIFFFIMLILLGLDTIFTGLETITSTVIDMFPREMRKPGRREIFLLIFCSLCFVIQISLTTQGGVYQFQLMDHYGSNGACVVFVCMVQCVAVGWAFGAKKMIDAVEKMTGQRPSFFFYLCWRYLTPLVCLICFFCFFLDYKHLTSSGGYVFPEWSYCLGWAMSLSSVIMIPIWAVGKMFFGTGSIRKRFDSLWRPNQTEGAGDECKLRSLP